MIIQMNAASPLSLKFLFFFFGKGGQKAAFSFVETMRPIGKAFPMPFLRCERSACQDGFNLWIFAPEILLLHHHPTRMMTFFGGILAGIHWNYTYLVYLIAVIALILVWAFIPGKTSSTMQQDGQALHVQVENEEG